MEENIPKLLYLTAWDFQSAESDGICKKILTQIDTFKKAGYCVDFGYTKSGMVCLDCGGEETVLGRVPVSLKVILAPRVFSCKLKEKEYDAIYLRHCVVGPFYIQLLATLRHLCKKIVVEIPTYPYYEELKEDIKLRMAGCVDRVLSGQMKKYVNRIVTFSEDKTIFGIPTIRTINGIDFSKIRKIRPDNTYEDRINIIAVANLAIWHGFDRLLVGLGEYYCNGGKRNILFHLIGNGEVLESYKQIVEKWNIHNHVIFYGKKYGEELDKIYDYCDLAIECLGLHRKGISRSSSLKSREYCAKGLPILTSTDIDIFENVDTPYLLRAPADETPVNIEEILKYYDNIYQGKLKEDVSKEIRTYSEKLCDISVTMKPIMNYFKI